MTAQQEQQLFSTLRSLRKEVAELKDMVKPYIPDSATFLNTKQAMAKLGIGNTKMREMLANGEFPFATKVGRQWRFSETEIIKFISNTRS